ncbi:MAG TPA: hypothetical protein VHY59_01110, partial [Chthoniobacterales bacterium]|nr:hypothetical protein [Chthoniobacterales bacterium]
MSATLRVLRKCSRILSQRGLPDFAAKRLHRTAQGFSAPWKGRVDPVGGSDPTRQLLLQPEAVEAWWAGNGSAWSP